MGGFLIILILLTSVYTFGTVMLEYKKEKPKTQGEQRFQDASIGMFIVSAFILFAIALTIIMGV